MNDKMMKKMLEKADFSRGTDLKERLYAQLFGAKVVSLPGRRALDDDMLDLVNAAGDAVPGKMDELKE